MRFTGAEMICFNSMIDERELFGVRLPLELLSDRKMYINQTKESLRQKGILDEHYNITAAGRVPVKLLYEYKKAEKHIIFNNMRIALIDRKNIIAIGEESSDYSILAVPKTGFLQLVLNHFPFMRGGGGRNKMTYKQPVSQDVWEAGLTDVAPEDLFMFVTYRKERVSGQFFIYQQQGKIFCYDYLREWLMEQSTQDIKWRLMDLLEIMI